jgi:hypothetical protein
MNQHQVWQRRLGFYQVGPEIFVNKSQALLAATAQNLPVRWNFNDQVYASIDWTTPIQTPLDELYRIRATQIREKYDHLILYFSGGGDSTNVLHAFIDNGIFLDEIVMQYPKPVEGSMNDQDRDNNNYFSEIKFQAIPYLQDIRNQIHPNTKIRIVDQYQDTINLFSKEDWFDTFPLATMITPAGAGRQLSAIKDPALDPLFTQGKRVCQIFGVDKPLVTINDQGEYVAYFVDANATHAVPTGYDLGDLVSKFFFVEFFYWTPDLPEIVIKQAQVIKQAAEASQLIHNVVQHSRSLHADQVRSVIHPLIYCQAANKGVIFQVGKPSSEVFRPMDKWFWQPEFKIAQQHYLDVINYLGKNIRAEFFTDNNVYKGLKSIQSEAYRL